VVIVQGLPQKRVVETRGRVRKGLERVYTAYSPVMRVSTKTAIIVLARGALLLARGALLLARGALLP